MIFHQIFIAIELLLEDILTKFVFSKILMHFLQTHNSFIKADNNRTKEQ